MLLLFHLKAGSWIPDGPDHVRVAIVTLGIYLFGMAYSPGMGPVPFTVG